MGVTNICFVIAIQADVDWSQRGAAMSSVSFSRIIGQSLGSAVFGGILNVGLSSLAGGSGSDILRTLRSGDRQIADAAGLHSVIEALNSSLHNIYLVSGLLALAVSTTVLTYRPT